MRHLYPKSYNYSSSHSHYFRRNDSNISRTTPTSTSFNLAKKTGIDVECQIEDGDLFNFDEEVKPLIHIIVSKTLEDARREVLEEEELRHIMEQQEKYRKLNLFNSNRIKELEENERKKFEEHKRKKDLKENRISMTKMFQKKLQSRMKAKQYISKLKLDTYNTLGQQKIFKNKDDNYYFTDLLP